jgi:ribosomal protein L3 glutamine methyltransferase
MTVYELIEEAKAALLDAQVSFGHGTTNAFDEAAWLVLWALHIDFSELEARAQHTVPPEDLSRARALIQTRIHTRQPAAYLTQEAWLQNVPFYVDTRSIVPRSLIAELLVDGEESGQLDAWLSVNTHRVLDLCTGNGSLAVIAAMAFPDVQVDAADLSPDALAVARINVDRHRLQDRIRLIESDAWGALNGTYDLVLCNPPYVNEASMQALPPEYRHEPRLALAGGTDGMDLIRTIVQGALAHLTPIGVLVLEIGHERAHFERAFPRLEAVWLDTSAGSDSVLLLTRDALARAQRTMRP